MAESQGSGGDISNDDGIWDIIDWGAGEIDGREPRNRDHHSEVSGAAPTTSKDYIPGQSPKCDEADDQTGLLLSPTPDLTSLGTAEDDTSSPEDLRELVAVNQQASISNDVHEQQSAFLQHRSLNGQYQDYSHMVNMHNGATSRILDDQESFNLEGSQERPDLGLAMNQRGYSTQTATGATHDLHIDPALQIDATTTFIGDANDAEMLRETVSRLLAGTAMSSKRAASSIPPSVNRTSPSITAMILGNFSPIMAAILA